MDAAAEIRRNPSGKHEIQPEYGEKSGRRGTGWLHPSREAKLSSTIRDREILIFLVEMTMSRICDFTP